MRKQVTAKIISVLLKFNQIPHRVNLLGLLTYFFLLSVKPISPFALFNLFKLILPNYKSKFMPVHYQVNRLHKELIHLMILPNKNIPLFLLWSIRKIDSLLPWSITLFFHKNLLQVVTVLLLQEDFQPALNIRVLRLINFSLKFIGKFLHRPTIPIIQIFEGSQKYFFLLIYRNNHQKN